uniref:P-type domain-containing protein n=1 Tax=Strigamia maritima TaxID=126957 RepID=T1JFA2_STRMM
MEDVGLISGRSERQGEPFPLGSCFCLMFVSMIFAIFLITKVPKQSVAVNGIKIVIADVKPGFEYLLLDIRDKKLTISNDIHQKQCGKIDDNFRFDCYSKDGASQEKCEARGCCWAQPKENKEKSRGSLGVPFCFYPSNYPGYYFVNSTQTEKGVTIIIERNTSSYYGNDVMLLKVDVELARYGVRTKIYDPLKPSFEVPYPIKDAENVGKEKWFNVHINRSPFSMKIFEKNTNRLVYNILPFLIYTDQFIQVPSSIEEYVYSLDERNDRFLRSLDWKRFVMFSVDQHLGSDFNASQPFMLHTSGNGFFVGTFFYNSKPIEVILQPAPAYTIRARGGTLDVYSFIGSSAAEAMEDTNHLIAVPPNRISQCKPFANFASFIFCICLTVTLVIYFNGKKEIIVRNQVTIVITDVKPGLEYLSDKLNEVESTTLSYDINEKQCANIDDNLRFDCYPEDGASQEKCEARGCCWAQPKENKEKSRGSLGVPFCFYPSNFPGYYFVNSTQTEKGVTIFIERNTSSYYGNDVMLLKVDIELARYGVRTKVYDPLKPRYEVPYPIKDAENVGKEKWFNVHINRSPFSMKIFEKNTNRLVYHIFPFLIYTDQFIQVPSSIEKYVYGLGERKDKFLRSLDWQQFVMFSADQYPIPDSNLYGSQPFMLYTSGNGFFVGTLIYNSNAMEVILQPAPAYTVRTLGGVLDIYNFIGGSAAEVIQQYQNTIGLPNMPPYWALGFQLCRFGLNSTKATRDLWQRTRDAGIPFDVQWNDIDYMDDRRDFTYDPKNYGDLAELVDDIHKAGMHYVVMMDAALDTPKNASDYPPWADGVKRGIFVNDSNGNPFIGRVWSPNGAAWPDFTNPKTTEFWTDHLNELHEKIQFDGLWIDMNEPSNFYDGFKDGCPVSKYDNPPYVPHVQGRKLSHKTICMSAQQHAGLHYDVHNLYGYSETIATNKALRSIIPGKRPFIVSRSTFPGHGQYGNHWTGDVYSTWDDLHISISNILNFNLFGIPMVGADICGFNGNTTVKLCQRWMELGAFYPFSRNHNTDDAIDQDPVAMGPEVVQSSRNALSIRYILLPYLYTLFYRAHVFGETVARPLFFEFPDEIATYSIDTQFMWGPGLLILPVLAEDQTTLNAYLPKGLWYFWGNYTAVNSSGETMTIYSPPGVINVALRGGYVFPAKPISNTTTWSREWLFVLVFALDELGESLGELYWDDGESLDTYEKGNYNLIRFVASDNTIRSTVVEAGASKELTKLETVMVIGLNKDPTTVNVNGKATKDFHYNAEIKNLIIRDLEINLDEEFTINWQ